MHNRLPAQAGAAVRREPRAKVHVQVRETALALAYALHHLVEAHVVHRSLCRLLHCDRVWRAMLRLLAHQGLLALAVHLPRRARVIEGPVRLRRCPAEERHALQLARRVGRRDDRVHVEVEIARRYVRQAARLAVKARWRRPRALQPELAAPLGLLC